MNIQEMARHCDKGGYARNREFADGACIGFSKMFTGFRCFEDGEDVDAASFDVYDIATETWTPCDRHGNPLPEGGASVAGEGERL